jgi:hypothetical protein
MKIFILVTICFSNLAFCQLDETKKNIDSRLISTSINTITIGKFREEIKLANKSLDTVKVWYNTQNLAKFISVSNNKKGIDNNYFHKLSTHFNIGFNLTNSLKIDNREFFYDSKIKRLIIKIYNQIKQDKLIEVQFISDFETIKNILPETKNW